MVMRVLARRRTQPAPVTGTFFSLAAHAALFAALVGGRAAPGVGGPTAAPGEPDAERVQWVGVGRGGGAPRAGARRGGRPPIAYVVPGRGTLLQAAHLDRARREGSGLGGRGPGVGGGAPDGTPSAAPHGGRGPAPDVRAPHAAVALGPAAAGARPARAARRPVRVVLPDLAVPDAAAMRLVAGVLSASPDLARRAERDDFVPAPAALAGDLLAQLGAPSLAGADVHLNEVPIPLVGNRPPDYPAALARAGVTGHVVVEFLIDSTGTVDVGTLRVVESTDARFTEAVRGSLPALRFTPALRGERAVGVTVRQPYVFARRQGV